MAIGRTVRLLGLFFVATTLSSCWLPQWPAAQCAAQESAAWDDEVPDNYFDRDFEDLPPAMQAAVIIVALAFLLAVIGLTVFIIFLLYRLLDALPPAYRLMEPGMVWLLLIPCFNVIWNFFVYPRIARSYQNYFYAHGRTDVGDCGASIGIALSVCAVLISIPCLNYITGIFCGPAILVLQIIYLVRLYGLKSQIQAKHSPPSGENQR